MSRPIADLEGLLLKLPRAVEQSPENGTITLNLRQEGAQALLLLSAVRLE